MSNYLSPRSSIGIIGTNEQAYQLALAAKKLGYRVNVLKKRQLKKQKKKKKEEQ